MFMKRCTWKNLPILPGLLALLTFVSLTALLSCALPAVQPQGRGGLAPRAATPGAIMLSSSTPGASSTPRGSPTPGGSATPGGSPTLGASSTPGGAPTATASPTPVVPPASGGSNLLISRKAPAFASSAQYPASQANDASYDTTWRSNGTGWLAYDLSSVPASHRSRVVVVWYNESYNYDHTIIGDEAYNMPQDYTIQVNAGAGGGSPPANGWVTLVTVTGNHYHSRQHVITMTGDNWVRINVTAVDGSVQNYDVDLNMDVYDASAGLPDDWIFFGDSITAGAMGHTTVGGVAAFAQLVNAKASAYFPLQEAGGIGYLTSADGAQYLSTWLALFPGKYVGLSYGTNDANGCVSATSFYQNYVKMVQAVLAAGKIPVIPHIPWGRTSNIQNCAPGLNARIDALYQAYPQIIKGPDLWAYFQAHQSLISSDNIHPSDTGFGAYRQQWANTMLTEVYGA
jgi:lysophospholipase L1-like esterase